MLIRTRAALGAALLTAGLLAVPAVALGQTDPVGCADVSSREEAQAALAADPSNPLDGDGDGIACETWDYSVDPPVDRSALDVSPVDLVLDAVDALDCDGYRTQLGAIDDAVDVLPVDTSRADRGRIDDALGLKNVELDYCVGSVLPPDGDGSALPSDGGSAAAVDAVLADVAALDCEGFETQLGAINDAYLALPLETSSTDYGRINDASALKAEELGYCVESFVSTADDGSTAVTSGEQVTAIPEGSAETGRA